MIKNIRHPSLIDYLDYFEDPKFCILCMQLHGVSWNSAQPLRTFMRPPLTSTLPTSSTPPFPNHGQKWDHETSRFPTPPTSLKRSITTLPGVAVNRLAPKLGRRQSMDLFECIETVCGQLCSVCETDT